MSEEVFATTVSKRDKMNIICDIDEVIVNQTPKWCRKIYNEIDVDPILKKELIKDDNVLNDKFVLFRDKYYLSEWLKSVDEVSEYTISKIMSLYEDDDTFYDDLFPTRLGIALSGLVQTKRVEHIYYISKSGKNSAWESKLKFMDKHMYVEGKTSIIRVPLNKAKSEYINKHVPDISKINTLFEDQPSNIHDILNNSLEDNEVTVWTPFVGYGIQNEDISVIEEYDKNKKEIRVFY